MSTQQPPTQAQRPENPDFSRMPGHWVLARMGKRVLRPGGVELTRQMLAALQIGPQDDVVELAPGLGATALLTLEAKPATYVAIERDYRAAATVVKRLDKRGHRCLIGTADATGLEDATASVVYGEAMLTMQTAAQKSAIVREAFRILKPGGRYGIHELGLEPTDLDDDVKERVKRDLSEAIRVGARPLTQPEWRAVLEAEGFEVRSAVTAPMHLLELKRVLRDEGFGRALRILFRVICTPAARRRVLAMRRAFRQHDAHLCAITLLAQKPA